jgi:glycosyltransferase involved in cell wall biosynthesis
MKIGIMLRHLTQHGGGVLVYTHNLLREVFALQTSHEFSLLYQDPKLLGRYAESPRVREIAFSMPSIFLWDQIAVRQIEKKEKFDVIFNPKYSLPLSAKCRTVFVCHGLDWYVMPWGSSRIDRLSHRYLIPRYARKADAIIAVSNTARQHVIEYLHVDESRVHTVYLGVDEIFSEAVSDDKKEQIRQFYRLPERFFLYCGQIYPAKNFGRLLRAYAKVGPALGIPLVVAGQHTSLSEDEIAVQDKLGIRPWIVWPGWIGRDALPAFYAMAEALLLPSLYESFGLPLVEAMLSGCPIVTANRYAPQELVGQAGILVDPESTDSIANGISEVVTNRELRQKLVCAGRERGRNFSWRKCAQETLRVLEEVHA